MRKRAYVRSVFDGGPPAPSGYGCARVVGAVFIVVGGVCVLLGLALLAAGAVIS